MSQTTLYRTVDDLPATLPVFPLSGALLLPRGQLPLNIFEPRYLAMVNDVLGSHRMIGMVQPKGAGGEMGERDPDAKPDLYETGCAGRITAFSETGDGRILIQLSGVCRFKIEHELDAMTPYRQCRVLFAPFASDLQEGFGEDVVDREALLDVLKRYLTANSLQADWEAIEQTSTENLVNSLSMMSPFGVREKQALLEAESLEKRNQTLIALAEMALVANETDATVQ